MGFESTLLPTDPAVDKNEIKTSQAVNCDLTLVEEVEKSVGEVLLHVPLENKEDVESLGTICHLENNKGDVAEAITPPEGDKLELPISSSSEVADESLSSGCQTPRESIFDPFAPGPEAAACAPKKKVIRGIEIPSRRQLNFESGDYPVKRLSYEFDDYEEENQFLQGIAEMFLDLIISNQALEATGNDLKDASPPESCKTPVSKPLLTGIADTCPDAPLRPSLKVVKLSPSICRKLDFGSVSPKYLFVEGNKE